MGFTPDMVNHIINQGVSVVTALVTLFPVFINSTVPLQRPFWSSKDGIGKVEKCGGLGQ